jgi:hypothetical protein
LSRLELSIALLFWLQIRMVLTLGLRVGAFPLLADGIDRGLEKLPRFGHAVLVLPGFFLPPPGASSRSRFELEPDV